MATPRRFCACGQAFHVRTANHRSCWRCAKAHRVGRRCESLAPCKTCDRALARLAAYNHARKHEGADKDRRRGATIACPCGCGATYAGFRAGLNFADTRRTFITDEPSRVTGKRQHGRRNMVLGRMHEDKQRNWRAMVDEHLAAKEMKHVG